jgi:iron complex transport system substrate-binding protein
VHEDERRGAHPPAGGGRLIVRRAAAALVAALAALALAACGGDDDGAGGTRTVQNAFGGMTEVPAEPERVVVLNGFAVLDAMIAMGMPPVAAAGEPDEDTPFGAWLTGMTDGVEVICCSTEPKLEEIVAQDPDLILANPWQTDLKDELSAIAPTIGVPLSYADYEQEVRDIAAILGTPEAAGEAIAAHEERLAAFRSEWEGEDPGIVSVARVFPDNIRVEGTGYVPTLLTAAGLERVLTEDASRGGASEAS